MARRRREHQRHPAFRHHPIHDYVERTLAAADPFYHGELEPLRPPADEAIEALDPQKTAHDLGRLEAIERAMASVPGSTLDIPPVAAEFLPPERE